MGDTAQDGNDIFSIVNNFICQRDAEISIVPTIVIPLNTVSQGTYRVRTLMDTGSMTNWIARTILKFITYTTKGHTLLEVITMTGRERKRFELVEVFFNGNDKVNNLTCYVYDGFAKHVTVKGLPKLLQDQNILSNEQCNAIVDPASSAVDHAGMSLGIGIIMCPASISKIRCGPTIHFDILNISLEPTIFGLAISGEVPRSLKDKVNSICNQCTIALQVCNHITVPKLVQKLTEPLFKTESQREEELKSNLNFLGDQESLGIYPEEIHRDDETAWNHFVSTTVRKGQEFEVKMPFNDKVHLLKSNKSKAAGRTRSEQAAMMKNPAYMTAMCNAHQVFIDTNSVEVVDPSAPVLGPLYYMPFRGILKVGSSTECRICMDASSKTSASDVRLNQALYQGPNLVLNLAVLLKFMKGKYGTKLSKFWA